MANLPGAEHLADRLGGVGVDGIDWLAYCLEDHCWVEYRIPTLLSPAGVGLIVSI